MSLIILEGKVDVSLLPIPPSGSLILAYDIDGSLKQKNDAGVVSSVSGSLPLSNVLSIGNSTNGNDIILSNGTRIKGQLNNNQINLDDVNIILTTDNGLLNDSFLFLGIGGNLIIGNNSIGSNLSISPLYTKLQYNNSNSLVLGGSSSSITINNRKIFDSGNGINSGSGGKSSTIISSDSSTILSGVINTVVLGSFGIVATQSNSTYVGDLYVKGNIRNVQNSVIIGSNIQNEGYIDSTHGIIGIFNGNTYPFTKNGILIYNTNTSTTSPNIDSNIVYISSRNSSSIMGVKNTVVIGGVGRAALSSNTVYLGNTVNINNRYNLPTIDGSSGNIMKTDGLGNASWGTLDGYSLNLSGLTVSGVANFNSLNFSYLTLIGLTVSGTASFSKLSVPYLNLNGLTAGTGSFGMLNATSGSFSSLNVNSLVISNLNSVNGFFVNSMTASIGNFTLLSATNSNFTNLNTNGILVNSLTAGTGSFTNLITGTGSFANLIVPYLSLQGLTVSVNSSFNYINVSNINAIYATVSNITANNVNILGGSAIINGLTTSNSNISNSLLNTVNIINSSANLIGLTVSGTVSLNRIATLPSNNNVGKVIGLSGSQLVEVSTYVNGITSSNGSLKIGQTGSNYTYDISIGFTSSNNTIKFTSSGATGTGVYNLTIATDSKATASSNNFLTSGVIYNELLLKQNLPTGFVQGLTMGITPGDNTRFNISYGGFLVTDYSDIVNVSSTIVITPPSGLTGIRPIGLTSAPATYIALDRNLNVVQSLSPFTDADRRTLCLIGVAVHSNLSTINTTNEAKAPIIAPTNQLHDFIKAIGFLNLSGNVYSPVNSATGSDLSMKKSAGEIWGLGINGGNYLSPHKLVMPAQATFSFRLRQSSSPIVETGDITSLVGNLNYETIISSTNSTLTAIPNNKYGVFHGTLFQSGLTRIQYPQRIYDTLVDAVNSSHTEDFVVESNIRDNGIFRFYLVIRGGTTNFNDSTRYQFLDVGKFGNVAANAGGNLTFANIIATLGYTPESTSFKQNSLLIDGSGQKYVTVDAVNSGFSIKKSGSYIYSASQSSISHTGGTNSTLLTNNGTGTFSVSYAPTGLTAAIWNVGTNRFNFSEMSLGDTINIQIDMNIVTSTTDQEVEIYLVLAEGTAQEYQLTFANSGLLKRNSTYPFVANTGVLINTNLVKNNPAKLIFKSSANAIVEVKGWYITVRRY